MSGPAPGTERGAWEQSYEHHRPQRYSRESSLLGHPTRERRAHSGEHLVDEPAVPVALIRHRRVAEWRRQHHVVDAELDGR
jgi:hypothetical protein